MQDDGEETPKIGSGEVQPSTPTPAVSPFTYPKRASQITQANGSAKAAENPRHADESPPDGDNSINEDLVVHDEIV